MIAVHITHEHAYHQILNEGLIKPSLVQRPDMEGFGGYGFGADGLAGDTRFVFLRLSEKYQLITSTEKCFFVRCTQADSRWCDHWDRSGHLLRPNHQ